MKSIALTILLLFSVVTAASAQRGTWSGNLEAAGTKLPLVFHLNDEKPLMDSPNQGARGIPVQIERTAMGRLIVSIPSLAARYEGMWVGDKIIGTFSQMGMSIPLTLTEGEQKPKRPQTPQPPFPYTEEEVSFANGDISLQGTLVLPQSYSRKTPVLLMVTGSGVQNRDEELFDHKPFAVIADALARAGIASLRYDDRGYGRSDIDLNACTTEDFKNDALAGLRYLRTRFDKLGVLGHSEGGSIAFMIAAQGEADFVVSLAGMVVSGAETLVWQNGKALVSAGIPEEAAEKYCALIADAFDALVNGGEMPRADALAIPEVLKQNYSAVLDQIQTPYMKYMIALDLRSILDRVDCPVLALNGTKDMQVYHQSNLDALRSGLAPNAKTVIEPVEGVNHLFQTCGTGAVSEYAQIEQTMEPAVLEKITSWINSL